MKLAIIGGSAASTPALFCCDEMRAAAGALDIVLTGRSRERLDAVARAIGLVTDGAFGSLHTVEHDTAATRSALHGCDVVLVQVRCGGYHGRAHDEAFPLRFAIPGDEGLGPGGLSAAWRTCQLLRDILGIVREESPNALVIIMTSPVSLLVRCIAAEFAEMHVAGICELPWTTLKNACESVGADPSTAAFTYAGVNHLGWIATIRSGGRDVAAQYAAQHDRDFPSRALIESCGVPLKYLRLHYERDAVVREQRASPITRGAELETLQRRAIEQFASGDRDEVDAAIASRPTPWYSDALAPLIASIALGTDATIPFFLSVPCRGALDGFDDDDILELAHEFVGGRFELIDGTCGLTPQARPVLEDFVRYERLAANAVLSHDRSSLVAALRLHPWVEAESAAQGLADAIVHQTRASEEISGAAQETAAAASLR